jgi:hypothetical protein
MPNDYTDSRHAINFDRSNRSNWKEFQVEGQIVAIEIIKEEAITKCLADSTH